MDYEYMRTRFRYDPDSGHLFWLDGNFKGKRAGTVSSIGYIKVSHKGKCYQAHRIAILLTNGQWPVKDVDHINGDRKDNRLCNLRVVTRSENAGNRHAANKNNTSGLLGAHKLRPGKWVAVKRVGNKTSYLGVFDSPEKAAAAYATA